VFQAVGKKIVHCGVRGRAGREAGESSTGGCPHTGVIEALLVGRKFGLTADTMCPSCAAVQVRAGF